MDEELNTRKKVCDHGPAFEEGEREKGERGARSKEQGARSKELGQGMMGRVRVRARDHCAEVLKKTSSDLCAELGAS